MDWNDSTSGNESIARAFCAGVCTGNDVDVVYNWVQEKMTARARQYLALAGKLLRVRFSRTPNKEIEYRRVIFYTLKEWGGVYIKFLQILAGMSKFMDGWGGPKEMEVFSQVEHEEIKLAEILDLDKFSWVSEAPVAAGSFALVYRGVLRSGQDVAIKILRPSIRKNLKKDLKILGRLCWTFSWFLPHYLVDYNDAYVACARMFILETDYRREVANQEYFVALYRAHERVVIPGVYKELSSENVIVQDFIEGPTLADVMSQATPEKPAAELAYELTGSELWSQVVLAGGEALYTAMCEEYVYGDPHPGNIILLSENRIGFVDFGIIAQKPTSHRAFYDWVKSYDAILRGEGNLVELLEATISCFRPDLLAAMQQCRFGEQNFLKIISESMNDKMLQELSVSQTATQLFENGHIMNVLTNITKAPIIEVDINTMNFEFLKAMQSFLGAVTILDNSGTRDGFAATMMASMKYALERAERRGVVNDVQKVKVGLTESYELIFNTLSSPADADEAMFNLVQERIMA